jgi:hypothetical protein
VRYRPPAISIADSPGVDFRNSLLTWVDPRLDRLDDDDGFLKWLTQSKLMLVDGMPTILDPEQQTGG